MKVVITGSAGFIGSHLAEKLSDRKDPVRLFDCSFSANRFDFDPNAFDCVKGDIQNFEDVNRAIEGCEAVFHLAGVLGTEYLVSKPHVALGINVHGTLNVLEAATRSGANIVFLSLLPRWLNPYMISKHCAEELVNFYVKEYETRCVVLRASHIYGPRQSLFPVTKAIPTFIMAALKKRNLQVFGSGNQLMDLLYVDDAVKAILQVSDRQDLNGEILELGSGRGISVVEVAKKIVELCESSSLIEFKAMRRGEPDSPDSYRPAKLEDVKKLLDTENLVSVDSGLRRTIEWYRSYVLPVSET